MTFTNSRARIAILRRAHLADVPKTAVHMAESEQVVLLGNHNIVVVSLTNEEYAAYHENDPHRRYGASWRTSPIRHQFTPKTELMTPLHNSANSG